MVANSPWSDSRPIPGTPPDSQEPVLTSTPDAVHAVWVSGKILYHACLLNGQWQAPSSFASGEQPALAAGPDGSLHCAFSHWFLGNCEIYYTHRGAAGEWSLPQLVSHTTGVSSQPALSVTPDGQVYVTWADTTPGPTTIYFARQQGVAWANAPIPNAQGSRPTIAAGPSGEVYIAWQDRLVEAESFEILAAIYRDGAWGVPQIVSDGSPHHSVSPALAVTPQGVCHLVWQTERGGTYAIRHAERLPDGWSSPVDLSGPHAGDGRLPCITAGPKGFPQALWLQGTTLMHRARPQTEDAGWWAEEVACATCIGVSSLAVCASAASGELHVIWSAHEESDRRRLFHIHRKPLLRNTTFMPLVAHSG